MHTDLAPRSPRVALPLPLHLVLGFGLAFVLASVLACGGSDGDGGPTAPSLTATVEFLYDSPTAVDPDVVDQNPDCVNGVGHTHIHPGWRNFDRVDMEEVGADRWRQVFSDVPTGEEQRIRISDPNTCDEHPTGASTEGVFANGVLLLRIVDTPGSGIEPGLAFTVTADGTVTP